LRNSSSLVSEGRRPRALVSVLMLDDDPSLRRDRRSTSNDYRSTRTDWLSSPRRLVFPRRETLPYVFPCFYFVHLLIKQGDDLTAHITRSALPLPASYEAEAPRSITSEEKEFSAFRTLRVARADQRNSGKRAARVALKEAAAEAAKK
jgi:hypothetical protein